MFWHKKVEPAPEPCTDVKFDCGVHHLPHVNMRAGPFSLAYEKSKYSNSNDFYIRTDDYSMWPYTTNQYIYFKSIAELKCLIKLLEAAVPELEKAGVV